ncbi:hypothetical protein [Mumia sp. DW29H23]|uniref:hypothetical protein n=1 Tax=Mumia sp. DW29H23 TaxID=3421241 RepID=UPI003D698391
MSIGHWFENDKLWDRIGKTGTAIIALATLVAVLLTARSTHDQSTALARQSETLSQQVALDRAESKSQQLTSIAASMTSPRESTRIMGLYGFVNYVEAFPEKAQQVSQMMAAYLDADDKAPAGSRMSRYERRVLVSLLTEVTVIGDDTPPSFDLAGSVITSAMAGLRSDGGYFRGTTFEDSLQGSQWRCVDAADATVTGSLAGASWQAVALDGADLRKATIDAETTISGYWTDGGEPKLPRGLVAVRMTDAVVDGMCD